MSRHEGVSCDSCLKGNFRGRRYKCLACYDYDLCETCYEAGATNTRHTPDHPMQCILTRSDYDLFYGGETIRNLDQPQSYTCPYCSKMGFTDATLQEHVAAEHADTSFEVVCPVCAAMPGGDPNLMTDDFAGHLTLEHRTGFRDLISFLDEPVSTRHSRRIPHSGHLGSSGRGGQSSRPRRCNMHFSSALPTLSPSSRDSVDPIAELLSQLSGVRRSTSNTNSSTPSQLQQLQMQLQLERQQVSVARQQLERLPRRTNQSQTSLRNESSNSASPGYSVLINPSSSTSSTHAAAATAPPVANTSNFLLDSLWEEFTLQSTSDEAWEDRRSFAEELMIATLVNPKPEHDSQGDSVVAAENQEEVSSDGVAPSSSPVPGGVVVTQSAGLPPRPSAAPATTSRVLRGRARSDNHNATRRADANKHIDGKGATTSKSSVSAAKPNNANSSR